MVRRIDLPDFVETRWMHCRLGRTPDTASRLTVELPFHLPPQRRPAPGPGIVPIVTDADGRRLIRFAVPIGPDFTLDEIAVDVDSAARQVDELPTARALVALCPVHSSRSDSTQLNSAS